METNDPIKKWAKGLNREISIKEIKVAKNNSESVHHS